MFIIKAIHALYRNRKEKHPETPTLICWHVLLCFNTSETMYTNVTFPCKLQSKHLPYGYNLLIKASFVVCVDMGQRTCDGEKCWGSGLSVAVIRGHSCAVRTGSPGSPRVTLEEYPLFGTAGILPEGVRREDRWACLALAPQLHVLVIRGCGVFLGGFGVQEEGVGDCVLHLEKAGVSGATEKPLEGGRPWLGAHLLFGSCVSVGDVGCGREAQSAGPAAGPLRGCHPRPKPPPVPARAPAALAKGGRHLCGVAKQAASRV